MAAGAESAVSLESVGRIVRKIAHSAPLIPITPHARREMNKDHINSVDIKHALKGCSCVRYEQHGFGDWRATCQGRTRDGEIVEIAVRIFEEENLLQVVTAYRVQ